MTVKLLTILAAAFAAGAAGHLLFRPKKNEGGDSAAQPQRIYELGHDETVIDDGHDIPVECRACVEDACRAMDFMTLQGASRVTFRTEEGEKLEFHIPGDSGIHLISGDQGLLEYQQQTFITFVKDSGEIVGALYHIPAEEMEE